MTLRLVSLRWKAYDFIVGIVLIGLIARSCYHNGDTLALIGTITGTYLAFKRTTRPVDED